jgi:hypothetical protein
MGSHNQRYANFASENSASGFLGSGQAERPFSTTVDASCYIWRVQYTWNSLLGCFCVFFFLCSWYGFLRCLVFVMATTKKKRRDRREVIHGLMMESSWAGRNSWIGDFFRLLDGPSGGSGGKQHARPTCGGVAVVCSKKRWRSARRDSARHVEYTYPPVFLCIYSSTNNDKPTRPRLNFMPR